MPNYCIVSEFNPLHRGHVYLFDEARRQGADVITCVMSGNSTQRGELAVTDKYLRARAAVECGADLVLELPFPWCSASADYFASAAVYIAQYFGDTLFFGSECGDTAFLTEAASYCETEEFSNEYGKLKKNGGGAAGAFLDCLSAKGFKNISSNDILGIAYIRAVTRLNAKLKPHTVRRMGAAYNDEQSYDGMFSSAKAIRTLVAKRDISSLNRLLPEPMARILIEEINAGRITEPAALDAFVLAYFRLLKPSDFENTAEAQGGVANRLIYAANEGTSFADMLSKAQTKRYTDARLRRAVLFGITRTKTEELKALPTYTALLAANERGRALLAQNKRNGGITVITKPASAPRGTAQFELNVRLEALYGTARRQKLSASAFLKKSAYVSGVSKEDFTEK